MVLNIIQSEEAESGQPLSAIFNGFYMKKSNFIIAFWLILQKSLD